MITSYLPAIGVSVLAFIATNLENLVILLTFLYQPHYPFPSILVGYVGATALILVVAYSTSQLTQLLPHNWIHYLGILPISLGIWELIGPCFRSQSQGENHPETDLFSQQENSLHRWISVGLVTLGSGGDSLIVFGSLFSDSQFEADGVIIVTSLLMSLLWIGMARWLLRYPLISQQLNRWGNKVLPLLLIGIGIFILMDTPGDLDHG